MPLRIAAPLSRRTGLCALRILCGKLGMRFDRQRTTCSEIQMLAAESPSMTDYYSIVAQAVNRLPSNTDEARRAIYRRARTALRETLATLEPAVSGNAEAALEAAIAKIEMDLLMSIMRRFVREE